MKRLIYQRYGDPEQVLELNETPAPVPAEDELLVRMLQRPINPYELALISNSGVDATAALRVPGFEGVGVIVAVGNSSLPFKTGQRVIPVPVELPGTWQEFVTGRHEQFIAVPDDIGDTPAALILNPLTCLVLLEDVLKVKEGQWLINTAASTNIGQLLIQFSRIMKFKLINLVRNRASEEYISALGACHVINPATDDLLTLTERLTKGQGVSGVIDPVGGRLGSLAVKTLGFGGKMVLFSDMSGEPVFADPMEFINKKLTVTGYTSLHWLNENSYERKSTFITRIFEMIGNGSLDLKADRSFPLADFAAAIKRSKESGRSGKVLLVSDRSLN